MRYLSPMRYPGGKARMAEYIFRLMSAQEVRPKEYVEPFAGGAGAALRLLVDERVRRIHINDLDRGIYAFWESVFSDSERLAARVESTIPTVESWLWAKKVYSDPGAADQMDLAFATFFLNRCNRSGILNAGPIGGLDQSGRWRIDARYNAVNLAQRIRFLGRYSRRVTVTNLDARTLLRDLNVTSRPMFIYVDPPYISQGGDLYLNALDIVGHRELAQILHGLRHPWLLTYDVNHAVTSDLYKGFPTVRFEIAHTAQRQHVGSELAVFSRMVEVPDIHIVREGSGDWLA